MTAPDAPVPLAGLLAEGRLDAAATAAAQEVKRRPTDAAARVALAELLILQGALDRAEAQLQVAAEHAPAETPAIVILRHLLRGAHARVAWHYTGAVPDFLDGPTPRQAQAMRLALAVRASRARIDDGPVQEVRDACDLSQAGFEALTLAGRYLWLAPERIESLAFAAPARPRDLAWRRAEARLRDGREATFLVLAQYHDPHAGEVERLARETAWIEEPGGVVRGRGQRVWLVGEDARDLLTIGRIVVEA